MLVCFVFSIKGIVVHVLNQVPRHEIEPMRSENLDFIKGGVFLD
jgi:hypothetical protein